MTYQPDQAIAEAGGPQELCGMDDRTGVPHYNLRLRCGFR